MINKHNFQQSAKAFRAGRLTLKDFTDAVFADDGAEQPAKGSGDGADTGETTRKIVPQIQKRSPESHKGDFGRVVLIGGSKGMAGAISLAGLAALRSGSGLVKVISPDPIQSIVAGFSPCYMTVGCHSTSSGEFDASALEKIQAQIEWADVVGLGPGLDRGPAQKQIAAKLYSETTQPMIVDADGLNSLADADSDLSNHTGRRVLTPHPGEFQRLVDSTATDRKQLEVQAIELARAANLVVVLKGHHTFVTDGENHFHNQTGNPGMATAGSGDVLTGVITSLVGQGLSMFDAAVFGVHVHGVAGDLMARQLGETSLVATDLVDGLSLALQQSASG